MRKRSLARRILVSIAVVVVACVLGALAVFLGAFENSVVDTSLEPLVTDDGHASPARPMSDDEIAALAPRGRYLAAAADCTACHTAPGGAPWAGGRAFEMPFGTLYATNISPDPTYGIGGWSRADFHRALRDGIGKGGRHLYPAMPYVSYRNLTAADVDALYAFLMTQAPMAVPNRADSFPFPYVRRFMTFWNLINLPRTVAADDRSKAPAWNRGRYLVDALGHCGECHTPRDFTMGMIRDRYLEGALIEGVDAPDITPAGLARLGFSEEGLARFLPAGLGPQGVVSFSMYDVVHHSTRYLTGDDIAAMAAYLVDGALPVATAPVPIAADVAASGRQHYVELCSACHGLAGEGIPHVAPAMATNADLRLPDARNLLVAVVDGLPARAFPGRERMQAMPAFADLLADGEIADLANYLRATWGGTAPDVTADAVSEIRRAERP